MVLTSSVCIVTDKTVDSRAWGAVTALDFFEFKMFDDFHGKWNVFACISLKVHLSFDYVSEYIVSNAYTYCDT